LSGRFFCLAEPWLSFLNPAGIFLLCSFSVILNDVKDLSVPFSLRLSKISPQADGGIKGGSVLLPAFQRFSVLLHNHNRRYLTHYSGVILFSKQKPRSLSRAVFLANSLARNRYLRPVRLSGCRNFTSGEPSPFTLTSN
jgi:hypothetical protein